MSFKGYRKKGYAALLGDADVRRWYGNLAKGSVILADVYLRALGRFCDSVGTSPKQFVSLEVPKMEETVQDFIDRLESSKTPKGKAYSPGYVESYLKAIRSWAEWNRKPLRRRIKIANAGRRPSLEDERTPTKEELKKVLYGDRTPLRARAAIALIAFSGTRIEVLGNYLGVDGLRVKDLPEMEIKGGEVSFAKVPTMIVVREEPSGSRHRYLTFLCEEGCSILKEYLQRRIAEGESLAPVSGIIATSPTQAKKSGHFRVEDTSAFLRTTKVGEEIRRAMRAVSLPWRPYVFRTYFDTSLMLAESRGLVSHSYQQFWMGHVGDIEAQYTTNKNRLPEDVVEDMRQAYKKCEQLMSTERGPAESVKDEFRKQLLLVAGFKEEEVDKLDLTGINDEDFQKMVRGRLLGVMANNGNRQRVIRTTEVKQYLGQGWEYVASLPDDKAILKLPH